MDKLFSKLRIGEKIAIGFMVVGLLLAGVVWHYHQTLRSVFSDYQQLQLVFERRKSLAFEIEIEMAAARDAEKNFLLHRQERFAQEVVQHLASVQQKVTALATIDQPSRQTAGELQPLLQVYAQSFAAVADAWRSMGLDENSGLQGAFRQKIHRLHELAAQYDVDALHVVLLQIRRNEKDLALRQEAIYRDRVRVLLGDLRRLLEQSQLPATVRQRLLDELGVYARSFDAYAASVLKNGSNTGGKGVFRDAARRIEILLDAYHVPNLEANVLRLRRREKDFLLRGDDSYPPMVVDIARQIRVQVNESAIAAADKALLIGLLRDYQRSFLVLVSQRASIAERTREMDAAAARVTPLIQRNADEASATMAQRVTEITVSSRASMQLDLAVLVAASVLAIALAIFLTSRIVRPVRQMAGLLDDLAYGTPTSRVPVAAGGRDEVNAMGESLNALLDHRAAFLGWWKASMAELTALREVENAVTDDARDEATRELGAAVIAKVQQLNALRGRLLQHGQHLLVTARAAHAAARIDSEGLRAIEHSAQAMATLLETLAADVVPVADGHDLRQRPIGENAPAAQAVDSDSSDRLARVPGSDDG